MRLNTLTKEELLDFCGKQRMEIVKLRRVIHDIKSIAMIGHIPNSLPKRF